MINAKTTSMTLLVLLSLLGCQASESPYQSNTLFPKDDMSKFVRQEGTSLLLNGEPFRFAGTNNYYMHYKSNEMIDAVLDDAAEMGLNAIRVWGFMEGISHSHTMQHKPGEYTPPEGVNSALERLDYTIHQAHRRGIRVVIALTNNWGDFGGMPQYVSWFNGSHHDDFYRNPQMRQAFKNYVKHIINHTNQYTDIALKDDPTIMTWELGNEPRAQSDKSGDLLYQWAEEMSDFVRQQAPNQLIALGSEGFFNRPGESDWAYNGNEGVDWERIITLPNINYGTFHLYPEHWGKHNAEQWGTQWIVEHAKAAKAANKPAVLEEYGIGKGEPQNRDLIYTKWTNTAYEQGLAGSMFWILTSYEGGSKDDLYPDYDGFRIVKDGGRTDQILTNHSKQMRGLEYSDKNSIFMAFPIEGQTVSTTNLTVSSYPFTYDSDEIESVFLRLPESEQEMEMLDINGDGYFEVDLKTASIGYGQQTLVAVASYASGAQQTDKISIKVDRPITGNEVGTVYDFEDGSVQGWQAEGTWQANWKNPALEVSDDLGENMLKLNLVWSGENDWEELKLEHKSVQKFSEHTRLQYDLYIPVNKENEGGIRPYAALGDGWVKLDTDKHRSSVKELKRVSKNGKEYYVQTIDIELGDITSKQPHLFICIVGDKLPLDGAVYIDSIKLLKPVY